MDKQRQLFDFITTELNPKADVEFDPDMNLLESGVLESMAMIELIVRIEETFDVERVAQCCDSNCYSDGTTIPVCSYNVLYRETEAHFMLEPKPKIRRRGGHLFPIVS